MPISESEQARHGILLRLSTHLMMFAVTSYAPPETYAWLCLRTIASAKHKRYTIHELLIIDNLCMWNAS